MLPHCVMKPFQRVLSSSSTNTHSVETPLTSIRQGVTCLVVCVLAAQQCICSFVVCGVMCVTGHQSWLDPCAAAGESGCCQVALGERNTQYGCDGVRCTGMFQFQWMNVRSWWALLVVVRVTAGCFCQFYMTEETHHHHWNPSLLSVFPHIFF